jgi:hypothetical protein
MFRPLIHESIYPTLPLPSVAVVTDLIALSRVITGFHALERIKNFRRNAHKPVQIFSNHPRAALPLAGASGPGRHAKSLGPSQPPIKNQNSKIKNPFSLLRRFTHFYSLCSRLPVWEQSKIKILKSKIYDLQPSKNPRIQLSNRRFIHQSNSPSALSASSCSKSGWPQFCLLPSSFPPTAPQISLNTASNKNTSASATTAIIVSITVHVFSIWGTLI